MREWATARATIGSCGASSIAPDEVDLLVMFGPS